MSALITPGLTKEPKVAADVSLHGKVEPRAAFRRGGCAQRFVAVQLPFVDPPQEESVIWNVPDDAVDDANVPEALSVVPGPSDMPLIVKVLFAMGTAGPDTDTSES
jgi:hypothetical protein